MTLILGGLSIIVLTGTIGLGADMNGASIGAVSTGLANATGTDGMTKSSFPAG
jgi:hypothetical protein